MKVRSNIKAGRLGGNHNEKTMSDENISIESGKSIIKKLSLKKETIRELKDAEMKAIAGGIRAQRPTETNCTFCC